MDLAKAGLAASGREQSLGAQLCGGLLINLKKPRTGGSQKSSRATFAQLISHHTQEHSQALWTTSGRPVTCPTSHCFGLGCCSRGRGLCKPAMKEACQPVLPCPKPRRRPNEPASLQIQPRKDR